MCRNNCDNCKRDLKEKGKIKLNVHHIKPVIKGGSNELDNLITLCIFCNRIADILYNTNSIQYRYVAKRYREYYAKFSRAIKKIAK
ncbi:MAG: HNH endonuclease [Nitrososphaera sp.]